MRAERAPAPRREVGLWFAFGGAATAWAVHLSVGWFLEEVVACGSASVPRGLILGIGVEVWILFLTGITGAVATAAGVIGYRWWRRRNVGGDARSDRRAFMAVAGMLSSGLFLPIILLGGLQVLTLHPCAP
jgi:hypothetical protein